MHVLGSSIRAVSALETLRRAEAAARTLGVTRCVDVTWLDRVGIPVFSATRPRAPIVCVTAGKGRSPIEAKVGALMEAIEQQVAHDEAGHAEIVWRTPRDVVAAGGPTLGSLAPRLGVQVDVDAPMAWIDGMDLVDGGTVSLPAELVLTPCPPALRADVFGSSTTGLASGNDCAEAILHALCEVLERDISSFQAVGDRSRLVRAGSLPADLLDLHERLNRDGLRAWLRWVPSSAGVAYFAALVADDDQPTPLYCNGGYGCHPNARIAATRALTEAAQSRMTYVQGAREDLDESYDFFARRSREETRAYRDTLIARYADATDPTDFDAVPTRPPDEPSALLGQLIDDVAAAGLRNIVGYVYRCAPASLVVVRVVVPGAEHFRNATARVGPRLVRYARAIREADAGGGRA